MLICGFLMHRVELKVEKTRPKGLESVEFLMHRVELKVDKVLKQGFVLFAFLMHRVELKEVLHPKLCKTYS